MRPVHVEVMVQAPRPAVWSLVTDIERAPAAISSIDSVEVLERPANGTFGPEAESHGSIYRTRIRLDDAAAERASPA